MQKSSSLFLRKIEQFIEQKELMSKNQLYLVALSGGADSVALLLVLKRLGYNVEAAHCNFHLRGEESDRDEDFCKDLCRELDIKLHLAHFDTQTNASLHGISIEMAARNLRYNYFEALLKDINASAVCVAHHKDDSAETLLLNLVRGTGIEGLTGIKSKNNRIVRPFLCVRRNEIINYLEQQNQSFVTDSSNLVNDVQRNKIRLDVMPLLQTINPSVVEHLNQTGEYVEDATAILNATLEQMYDRVVLLKTEEQMIVDIERLEKEQSSSYLLWYILKNYGFNAAQIKQISQGLTTSIGRVWESTTHALTINNNKIIVEPLFTCDSKEYRLIEEGLYHLNSKLSIEIKKESYSSDKGFSKDPKYIWIDADKVAFPLFIRLIKEGDRMIPLGMKGGKLISDMLTDSKVSYFDRQRQYVLLNNEQQIIWLLGRRIDDRYKITSSTKTVLKIKLL
ncbi:tRNA lysidine(34) synthetase TilS [Prevotella sp. oral taxon 299]|uniref:tRNA lysidine(34) synthetase TilS n=1 Tax=Prevotella sp. oral taxon 299 TaxID=652716 RepID=UPI00038DCBE2|nr:tRNA lysidine(34) synthetase TilS [Prevotella sp. oral taxon 299]EFC71920.2 tRNA(Ile)-lysidine synthetase [Prevotella sp. oral taxon 299 str. F0039]